MLVDLRLCLKIMIQLYAFGGPAFLEGFTYGHKT
jgi:hypothetical protein